MPQSKFGGVPLEETQSRFGGMAADAERVQAARSAPVFTNEIVPNRMGEPTPTSRGSNGFLQSLVNGIAAAPVIASGAIAEPIAGTAGIAQSLNPFAEAGAGAQAVEATREALTLSPKTRESKQGLTSISETVEPLTNLLTKINDVSGEIGYDLMGPIGGALGEALPTAVLEALGLSSIKPVSSLSKQSSTKQRIAEKLLQGSTDSDTAGFRLEAPRQSSDMQSLPPPGTDLGGLFSSPELPDINSVPVAIRRPTVSRARIDDEAIKQGFDRGSIAVINQESPATRAKMLQMVDIMEGTKNNRLFEMTNRPSQVAGDSMLERVTFVRDKNINAGKELDAAAQSLKGLDADFSPAVNRFIDDLDSMGITLNDDLTPNFIGSDIQGLDGPEKVISRLVARMAESNGAPSAYDMHRLKRYIDENVTYGSSGDGLKGKTQRVLKSLRRNLDGILDEISPEYNRVNTTYSDTIDALDSFQEAVGSKLDLSGGSADKSVGVKLRSIMSKSQARGRLLDSIEQIEGVAAKYGGEFDDSVLPLVMFVEDLDDVFGTGARTSFKGEITRGISNVPTSKAGAVQKAAEMAIDKVKGVNSDAAFKVIRELLSE
jgi:hypothetical protein